MKAVGRKKTELIKDIPQMINMYDKKHTEPIVKHVEKPEVLAPDTYIVKQIIDNKKIGNKKYYLVWWDKCLKKDATWEARSELIKTVPELIKEYEGNI